MSLNDAGPRAEALTTPSRAEQPGDSLSVWLLAFGQLIVYAGTYYCFPALLPFLEAGTGWSKGVLAMGPTLGFLIMASLTMASGKLVDRGLGGEMLIAGPVLAALGVIGLSLASTATQWLMAWAVIGLAQSGCLYETCFSFLTRRLGMKARSAIIHVTLVAGLSGTVTFPLAHVLGQRMGGQGALLVFALLVLICVVPLNLIAVTRLRRQARAAGIAPRPDAPGALKAALHRPEFWAIAAIVGLIWFSHGILLTYVLELLADRGASAVLAAGAAAFIGPAQVAGRLAMMASGARVTSAGGTVLSLVALVLAGVVLLAAGFAVPLVLLFALLQGAGIGLISMLRPILTADVLGRQGFGAISGAVAIPSLLGAAAAPAAGAWMLGFGGPQLVYSLCLAMAVLALIVGIWLAKRG